MASGSEIHLEVGEDATAGNRGRRFADDMINYHHPQRGLPPNVPPCGGGGRAPLRLSPQPSPHGRGTRLGRLRGAAAPGRRGRERTGGEHWRSAFFAPRPDETLFAGRVCLSRSPRLFARICLSRPPPRRVQRALGPASLLPPATAAPRPPVRRKGRGRCRRLSSPPLRRRTSPPRPPGLGVSLHLAGGLAASPTVPSRDLCLGPQTLPTAQPRRPHARPPQ